MLAIPNLRHLRAFEAVVRYGSVGQASSRIHVTQPAITQAIAKLEGQIGAPLFDRRPTGSYTTEAGRILLRRIERFFAMIEESLLAVDQASPTDFSRRAYLLNIVTSTHIRSLLATTSPASAAESAEALGLAELTLYRSVRQLEQILDCRLLRPSVEGLTSSPVGAELARGVGLAVRELDYAIDEIKAARGRAAARLSIGVLQMSGSLALISAINALQERYPDCRLQIIGGTYLDLLHDLRTGDIDCVFGSIRRPDWATDVFEVPLFDDAFCVVVRRDHPLTGIKVPTRAHLSSYEWIVPAKGTPRRSVIDHYFANTSPAPTFSIETSSISVIRSLVANSDRISVLSRHEVEFDHRARLFSVLPVAIGAPSAKGLTLRANWLPTPLHSEFFKMITQFTTAVDALDHAEPAAVGTADISPTVGQEGRAAQPTGPATARASRRRRAANPTLRADRRSKISIVEGTTSE